MTGEQTALWAQNEKSCESCKHFSELKTPRERSDGAVIYGYCFKDGDKNYSTNMGKGFPVFVAGAVCKSYAKQRKKEAAQ